MRRTAALLVFSLTAAACGGTAATTTTAVTTTTGAVTTTTAPPVPNHPAVAPLVGLPFDEFVDQSFDLMLLRSPQFVTELGLADAYGLRNDTLDDLSDEYLTETRAIEAAVLDLLGSYAGADLDAEQQVTFDVYHWYLDDRVQGHPFAYHDYPIHHMLGSYHWGAFFYLTDSFPLTDAEDAEDYVAAVGAIGAQAAEVLEGLEKRREMGIYPPDYVVEMARGAMLGQLGLNAPTYDRVDPTRIDVYARFRDDTEALGLDPDRRGELLAELEAAVADELVPAWAAIIDHLLELRRIAGSDAGLWKLPDGDAYYAYLVRHETSSDLTPDEIHRLGLTEVERVTGELREVFGRLGLPGGEPMGFSINRVAVEGGNVTASPSDPGPVITAYEEYLDLIAPRLPTVFDRLPVAEMAVLPDPSGGNGGYYSPGSLDGSRPGAFYAGVNGTVPRYSMPSLMYHEGMPGHHLQLALAAELGLPLMRSSVHFNGYVEGWALYAEYLAKELGVYDDDPYGDVGRLFFELLRAVRLVVDTGLHSKQWTRDQAREYMEENLGGWTWEVDRYTVMPAQALGYKIGMLEILRLRALAEDRLGDAFDLASFHNVVLGNGAVPLETLDRLVAEWIEAGTA